jgi:hypothetical protein
MGDRVLTTTEAIRSHVALSAVVPWGRIGPAVDHPAQWRGVVFLVSEVEVRAWDQSRHETTLTEQRSPMKRGFTEEPAHSRFSLAPASSSLRATSSAPRLAAPINGVSLLPSLLKLTSARTSLSASTAGSSRTFLQSASEQHVRD